MDKGEKSESRTYVPVIVNETPKFDLDSYIANYAGRTRFRRLFVIGVCSPVLRTEALKAAAVEARNGSDTKTYEGAILSLNPAARVSGGGGDAEVVLDVGWMETQEKLNRAETNRLEHELKGYKNNLIKESIRMGNEDLGNHYFKIGDLNNAIRAYSRMRDYCTTPAHIASTSFRIIQVAVEQGNWLAVQSQVHKIRNLQTRTDEHARNQPKIQAASGLYQMSTADYYEAAISFLGTDPSLGDSYNEVLTANDVAVYGGLCALASMSRQELQTRVLESASFRNFLELEPQIRRAISFFCSSKYAQCLDILESYRADYLLDIYLQPHVLELHKRIRIKAIVQYFEPFSRVTLDAMAQTFGMSTMALPATNTSSSGGGGGDDTVTIEHELIDLIDQGILNARIDLHSRVLVAKESVLRADVHREAQELAKSYIRQARMRLLRFNAIGAGLEVKPSPRQKQMEFGGGGGAGGGGGNTMLGGPDGTVSGDIWSMNTTSSTMPATAAAAAGGGARELRSERRGRM